MHRLSALALAALCSGCTAAAQYRPWPEATLAQPESITVGFNHHRGSSYISPLTGQRRQATTLSSSSSPRLQALNGKCWWRFKSSPCRPLLMP